MYNKVALVPSLIWFALKMKDLSATFLTTVNVDYKKRTFYFYQVRSLQAPCTRGDEACVCIYCKLVTGEINMYRERQKKVTPKAFCQFLKFD